MNGFDPASFFVLRPAPATSVVVILAWFDVLYYFYLWVLVLWKHPARTEGSDDD